MTSEAKAVAAREAMVAAVARLEECGAPLPEDGEDRLRLMERVHDVLTAELDRLPHD